MRLKKRGAMTGAHDLFIATCADGIELAIGADDAAQIRVRSAGVPALLVPSHRPTATS
jgi:hypothetical protein